MRRYFDYAILWDLGLVIIIAVNILLFKSSLEQYIKLPTGSNLEIFSISLITVSATLIGFLLTIITVIVTFKKGFEEKKDDNSIKLKTTDFPESTVFDKKISKQSKFYETPIHKRVVDVFIFAVFEIGFVLFLLIALQFNEHWFSRCMYSILGFLSFILILLAVVRSLILFRLFLNVHLTKK